MRRRESSSRARTRRASLALLALAACGVPTRAPPPAVAPPAAPAGPHYVIDAARSELRILVYRAGALARLGHNHVLLSRELAGEIKLAAPGVYAGAAFSLTAPVATLIVDDPAARAAEGEEVATVPTAADIEGTRRNLLSAAVLNGAACPALSVAGATEAAPDGVGARARLASCEHATVRLVPIEVSERDGVLTVRGGLSLRQSELGLAPFSVALGALAVRDQLELRFTVVAVPDAGG